MADKIVIRETPPYDGEYEFDTQDTPFNTHEWEILDQIAGIKGAFEVEAAAEAGSMRLLAAFAYIALERGGLRPNREVIMNSRGNGGVPFELVPEVTEDPLGSPEKSSSDGDESTRSESGSTASSGDGSTITSGESDGDQLPTGPQSSDTSTSHPLTLAS